MRSIPSESPARTTGTVDTSIASHMPSRRSTSRWRFVVGAVGALLLSQAAFGNTLFCSTSLDRNGRSFYFCADTGATAGGPGGGSTVNVGMPDALSNIPVQALSGAGGSGAGVLVSASADFAGLHGQVTAFSTMPPPSDGISFSGSNGIGDADIFDTGVVTDPTGMLAIGTAVTLHVTMAIEGTFAGTGEARTDLTILNGFTPIAQDRRNISNTTLPGSVIQFDLGVAIGDTLRLDYSLEVEAGANNAPGGFANSLVDASNTAMLNLDFLNGITFLSASGRDYATNAVGPTDPGNPGGPSNNVPEPPAIALLGLGFVALAAKRPMRR